MPAISAESESLKSLIWNTTKISVATVPESRDSWRTRASSFSISGGGLRGSTSGSR